MSSAPQAVWRFQQLQPGAHMWHPPPWPCCSCRHRRATARPAQCRAMGDDMPRIVEDIPRRFMPAAYGCSSSAVSTQGMCLHVCQAQTATATCLEYSSSNAGVHRPTWSVAPSAAVTALKGPRGRQAAAQLAPVRPHGGRVGRNADGAAGPVAAERPGRVVGAPLRCPPSASWAVRGRRVPDGAAVGGAPQRGVRSKEGAGKREHRATAVCLLLWRSRGCKTGSLCPGCAAGGCCHARLAATKYLRVWRSWFMSRRG